MATAATQPKVKSVPANVKKWGQALMAAGWTVIPNVIVQNQRGLGLDSIDINILLFLSTFWWTEDNAPYVSVRSIATAIGIKPRSVQRRIAALEALGFLRREACFDNMRGQLSNRYVLTPLAQKAEPFAVAEIARRAAKKSEAAKARARKIPQLRTVK